MTPEAVANQCRRICSNYQALEDLTGEMLGSLGNAENTNLLEGRLRRDEFESLQRILADWRQRFHHIQTREI